MIAISTEFLINNRNRAAIDFNSFERLRSLLAERLRARKNGRCTQSTRFGDSFKWMFRSFGYPLKKTDYQGLPVALIRSCGEMQRLTIFHLRRSRHLRPGFTAGGLPKVHR
jgi:hypothetical protein